MVNSSNRFSQPNRLAYAFNTFCIDIWIYKIGIHRNDIETYYLLHSEIGIYDNKIELYFITILTIIAFLTQTIFINYIIPNVTSEVHEIIAKWILYIAYLFWVIVGLIVGILMFYVWPTVQIGINHLGAFVMNSGYAGKPRVHRVHRR